MKVVKGFILGIVATLLVLGALNYHIIKTENDGIIIEPKKELNFSQTYVDVSDWGLKEYLKNRHIARIMVRRGFSKFKKNVFGE